MVGGQKLVILATPMPATRGPTEQQVECEPQLNVCQVKQSLNLQTHRPSQTTGGKLESYRLVLNLL